MADNIHGLPELLSAMKNLDAKTQSQIAPKMVLAAGRIIRKEARTIAQSKGLRKTGDLIRNIAIKRERNAPKGTTQYNVGVRHGRENKKVIKYVEKSKRGNIVVKRKNDPFYFRFLEEGTKYIQARPFLKPALENKQKEAIKAMEDALMKELNKVVK